MQNLKCLVLSAVCFFCGYAASLSWAEEIAVWKEVKITLVQAIQVAEEHLHGQAIEANLDEDSFKPTYEISVVKEGRIYDVRVDGVTREILDSREDTNGH